MLELIGFGKEGLDPRHYGFAKLREHNTAARPIKEFASKFFFEAPDLLAQRRLRNTFYDTNSSETTYLSDVGQDLQLLNIHLSPIRHHALGISEISDMPQTNF
jgi:hypothetical protein